MKGKSVFSKDRLHRERQIRKRKKTWGNLRKTFHNIKLTFALFIYKLINNGNNNK